MKKIKNTTHKMQNLSESYVQNLEHKATAKADLKSGSKNVLMILMRDWWYSCAIHI